MKVYIHIGSHKTGSTYIQKMCAELETDLSVQGVLYLKTGRKYFGHHQLVDMIRGKVPIDNVRALIDDELKENYEAILISSENFEDLKENEIERLISIFGHWECKVIYFFRNWSSLLHSMWQENVKHGAAYNFHMFVSEHVGFPMSSNILNYSLPLRKYAKVLGLQNLTVASYDLVCESEDLFDYFLSLIGATSKIEHIYEQVNMGFHAPIVECIRVLNSIAIARGYTPSYLVRQSFLTNILSSGVPDYLNNLFKIMNRYAVSSPNYSQSFAARSLFKAFLSEFGSTIAHDHEKCSFVMTRPNNGLYMIDPNYLLEPEARELIFKNWRKIEKTLVRETD